MNPGYAPSGNLTSSIKDANPEPGRTPTWGTLSWNASVPANTNLQFQVAASNSLNGPFSFVGPDATAGTFFSNGGSGPPTTRPPQSSVKTLRTTTAGAPPPPPTHPPRGGPRSR